MPVGIHAALARRRHAGESGPSRYGIQYDAENESPVPRKLASSWENSLSFEQCAAMDGPKDGQEGQRSHQARTMVMPWATDRSSSTALRLASAALRGQAAGITARQAAPADHAGRAKLRAPSTRTGHQVRGQKYGARTASRPRRVLTCSARRVTSSGCATTPVIGRVNRNSWARADALARTAVERTDRRKGYRDSWYGVPAAPSGRQRRETDVAVVVRRTKAANSRGAWRRSNAVPVDVERESTGWRPAGRTGTGRPGRAGGRRSCPPLDPRADGLEGTQLLPPIPSSLPPIYDRRPGNAGDDGLVGRAHPLGAYTQGDDCNRRPGCWHPAPPRAAREALDCGGRSAAGVGSPGNE
ncbi:hypothetical protein FQA39_LY18912 [Lamprigera yunnana]|nr:hypothetical protein FQA39_LY18912 [Lamprigera yunnana]